MLWSIGSTKPDWSADEEKLWIELKYVRRREDRSPILKAIAEDMQKYGDCGRRVLFIVYDPKRIIVDERRFCEPVRRNRSMYIEILR